MGLLPSTVQQNCSPQTGCGHLFTKRTASPPGLVSSTKSAFSLCSCPSRASMTLPQSSECSDLVSLSSLPEPHPSLVAWEFHGALSPSSLRKPLHLRVTTSPRPPVWGLCPGLSGGCWHSHRRLQLSEARPSAPQQPVPAPSHAHRPTPAPLPAHSPAGTLDVMLESASTFNLWKERLFLPSLCLLFLSMSPATTLSSPRFPPRRTSFLFPTPLLPMRLAYHGQ